MEPEVKETFRNRPDLVDDAEGFISLEVISPKENPSEIWLITNWVDEESFHHWHKHHKSEAHIGIPKGLKLVKRSFELRYFETITF